MAEPVRLTLEAAETLVVDALCASRTSRANAVPTARALLAAEVDGQSGHGLSRVPSYALQSRAGKVDGHATPRAEIIAPAAVAVDAAFGFAYPAVDLAIGRLVPLTRENGIAVASIYRSHHFGQAGAHAERLATLGLVAIIVGNTPKAMAFAGGRKPMMGTNPIAFGAPFADDGAPDKEPLVIDLALSVAARGKIVAAQKAGQSIPAGWAVDREGHPTTDPAAALAGTLSPIGGTKGAALALMVEVLAAALTGSSFGWEASSMFDDRDGPPNMGQFIIALDPQRLSRGTFAARMQALFEASAGESGTRLPGTRRFALRARAAKEGIMLPQALYADIKALIGTPV